MILNIVTYPNDILSTPTDKLSVEEILSKDTKKLIDDMIETCQHANGLGLAANQIGINKSVLIYNVPGTESFSVLINPVIIARSGKITSYAEGCLSIPEKIFNVKRSKQIKVEAFNYKGEPCIIKTKSKQIAKILQHEIDHLMGITLANKGKEIK